MTSEESAELKRLRAEVRELRRANEILKAASASSRPSSTAPGRDDPLRRDARGRFGVEPICRVLGATEAGFLTASGHDLRHTWATLAPRAGIHPKIVSEWLGHANISITLDIYSHVAPSLHAEAANTVASYILG